MSENALPKINSSISETEYDQLKAISLHQKLIQIQKPDDNPSIQ